MIFLTAKPRDSHIGQEEPCMTTTLHVFRVTCKDVKINKDIDRDGDSKKGMKTIRKIGS
jgi:hypothetical protein